MAVEARHLNLFPSHLLCSREMLNPSAENVPAGAMAKTMNNQMLNPPITDDSGLTFNNNVALPFSRKRTRETMNIALASVQNGIAGKFTGRSSFLGDDFSLQMMQQQLEVNRLISLHMDRVISEIEERRRNQSRSLIASIDEAVTRKLREKDEQIEKIGKINSALEERVNSLYLENQIWRDLAQTNEATAIALRSNLELVLNQVSNNNNADAESCCGSNSDEVEGKQVFRWRKVVAMDEDEERKKKKRMCRKCGKKESRVLVLPCRHLCLCSCCGPSVDNCPICNSTKNASVHVNFS